MAWKDIRASWWHFLVAGLLAMSAGFLFYSAAGGYSRCDNTSFQFRFEYGAVSSLYGLAAVATSLALGLSFAQFYGDEVRRGTIRALILYPVDLNDITLAKLIAATFTGSITSMIVLVVSFAPAMALCLWPTGGTLLLFGAALGTTVFILWVGAFLAHVVASVVGRLLLTPSTLAGLFLFLAILLTQTGLSAILFLIIAIAGGISPGTLQAIHDATGTVALVSPHHATATVLAGVLGPSAHFPDVFVVLPVGIAILAYGYFVGRRIPLDVFIK